MPRTVTIRPPAKINLTLRVGARAADGYHDVQTVLQSIDLADRLVARPRPGPFALVCRGVDAPADRSNLVWRAAERLWKHLGRGGEPSGAHVTLEKRVPAGAGLGGGSADAAAALVALARLWRGRVSVHDFERLGRELGADVPFFFTGGTALGLGRGDDLYPLADVRRMGVVILKPAFGVATADAYRWLDEERTEGGDRGAAAADAAPGPVDLGWGTRALALENDLAGPVSRRHGAVIDMVAACRQAGAWGAAMTGSGSAVFGLFSEAGARAAAGQLRRRGWLTIVTRTLTRREARARLRV